MEKHDVVVMFTDIEDGSLLFVMLASNFDDDFTKAAKEIVDRYLYAEEDDMSASNSIGNLLAHINEVLVMPLRSKGYECSVPAIEQIRM